MKLTRLGVLFLACGLLFAAHMQAQPATRWHLDGKGGIAWMVAPGDLHRDEIEMSGQRVSVVLRYGMGINGASLLQFHLVYPWLRTLPNNTNGSLDADLGGVSPRIFLNGSEQPEQVRSFGIHGAVTVHSTVGRGDGLELTQTIFPSTTRPLVFDRYVFTNHTAKDVQVQLEDLRQEVTTDSARGLEGSYIVSSYVQPSTAQTLRPGETASFALVFAARHAADSAPIADVAAEAFARLKFVDNVSSKMQLESPDPILNTEFAFAKIRTAESVFATKGGLFHSPGGSEYYAAAWNNDQMEYAAPFFGMFGDAPAAEATVNIARWFSHYMTPNYKPLPSSIIAEGASAWSSSGDRGDAAMFAEGMSRFALAQGNRAIAEELWPWIQWSLEYCHRKLTADGVVASDSDELEGRFPSGKANLSTSSLYYDALRSAAMLATSLGKWAKDYNTEADALHIAINLYFGGDVQGFAAYRYYDGDIKLRGWIAMPLAAGIFERKQGTIEALMSAPLWGPDGDVVEAGDSIFWDRATLYALRGAFAGGATEVTTERLRYLTERRLLGEHVPYMVEQGPGAVGKMHYYQRHLAGESALYARVVTEGLFGIRPTGLASFTVDPRLPKGWDRMALRNVHAFGQVFDLVVTGDRVDIVQGGKVVQAKEVKGGVVAEFAFGR